MVFTLAGDSTMMRSFVMMGQAIATLWRDGKGRGGEGGRLGKSEMEERELAGWMRRSLR